MIRIQNQWRTWSALIALLSLMTAALAEAPTLDWHRVQFAPAFILAGEAENQGFGDQLLRMLVAKMPQYRHRLVDAPLERALDRTGAEEGLACAGALLRTPEREARMHFSDPFVKIPPNGALVRASDLSRFEPFIEVGRLSLTRLLQTQKFVIGITRQRSYGSGIDAVLGPHRGEPYLMEKPGKGANLALLSDLSAQRGVDLVMAYALEAAYWLKTNRSPIPLRFLPIAEAPDNEHFRLACSRTPQGEQAILAINQLLADPEFRQGYLRVYADWQAQLFSLLPGAVDHPAPQD